MRKRFFPSRVRSGPSFWRWHVRDHRENVFPYGEQGGQADQRAAQRRKTYRRQWQEIRIRCRQIKSCNWNLLASFVIPGLFAYGIVSVLVEFAPFIGRIALPRYFDPKLAQARPTTDMYVGVIIAILFWLAVSIGTWICLHWAFRAWTIPQLAQELLRHGLCASCRYPLRKLPVASDTCTICPECGAAWKLNAPLSERVSE